MGLIGTSWLIELGDGLAQKLVTHLGWKQGFDYEEREWPIGSKHPNVLVGVYVAKCGLDEDVVIRELIVNLIPDALQLLRVLLDCLKEIDCFHPDEVA